MEENTVEKCDIKAAREQAEVQLEDFHRNIAIAKAERGHVRQGLAAANTLTLVIESYHGSEWADEIGTVESQSITDRLISREAYITREIEKMKTSVKILEKNIEIYQVRDA